MESTEPSSKRTGALIQRGNLDAHEENAIWRRRQKGWCFYKPRNAKIASQPSETRREAGNRFFPKARRRNQLCQHLDLDTTSELQNCYRMHFCVLAAHFVVFCYGSPGNKYRGVSLSLECVCGGHLDLMPGGWVLGGLTRLREGLFLRRASGFLGLACSPRLRGEEGTGNAWLLWHLIRRPWLIGQIPGLDILSISLCSADSPIPVREEDEEKTAEYLYLPPPLPHLGSSALGMREPAAEEDSWEFLGQQGD